MSLNICAGTVTAPSPETEQSTVSTTSMSKSVAVSFKAFEPAVSITFDRMGIVFRRSTTFATCARALASFGFSMVRRMVGEYPENESFFR